MPDCTLQPPPPFVYTYSGSIERSSPLSVGNQAYLDNIQQACKELVGVVVLPIPIWLCHHFTGPHEPAWRNVKAPGMSILTCPTPLLRLGNWVLT